MTEFLLMECFFHTSTLVMLACLLASYVIVKSAYKTHTAGMLITDQWNKREIIKWKMCLGKLISNNAVIMTEKGKTLQQARLYFWGAKPLKNDYVLTFPHLLQTILLSWSWIYSDFAPVLLFSDWWLVVIFELVQFTDLPGRKLQSVLPFCP